MKTIEMIVAPDGSSKTETKGFAGDSCIKATQFLERTLGQKHQDSLTTDFFSQRTSESQQTREPS
jgi:hypothetical protein